LHRRLCTAPPFVVSVLPWMHHRRCSAVSNTYRLIIVNLRKDILQELSLLVTVAHHVARPTPPKNKAGAGHKVLRAQNGGVPGFMADLRALTDS
ncbi:hypothetical protein PIB30_094153, partial [Stylosanthes scabra]|nr:hypothetical protein [Stylosanthes scabra]